MDVHLKVADAYNLPLAYATVDRVFLISVLPEIPDPDRALRALYLVLRPEGILSITAEFADPDFLFPSEMRRPFEHEGYEPLKHCRNLWRIATNLKIIYTG
jgi:ubiquinone/menaquinone biosynthesis C-methylase UbiE